MREDQSPLSVTGHGHWQRERAQRHNRHFVWLDEKDLMIAGARWIDQEVANNRGVITSPQPSDIPAFAETLIQQLQREKRGMRAQGQAA